MAAQGEVAVGAGRQRRPSWRPAGLSGRRDEPRSHAVIGQLDEAQLERVSDSAVGRNWKERKTEKEKMIDWLVDRRDILLRFIWLTRSSSLCSADSSGFWRPGRRPTPPSSADSVGSASVPLSPTTTCKNKHTNKQNVTGVKMLETMQYKYT